MKKELLIEETKHVAMSEIIPKIWHDWFFSELSESSTFTWGDANYTLVHADRFMDELEAILDSEEELEGNDVADHREAIIDTLNYLSANNIYIDLES